MGTLKFFPFNSTIQPGFWNSLAHKKLEELKLSETPLKVWGSFTNTDSPKSGLSPRLCLEWDGLEENAPNSWTQFGVRGEVVLCNTIESFKKTDKNVFMQRLGEQIWSKIVTGEFWTNPSLLSSFSVLMFGDLKKFQFYYWFAFPAFNIPSSIRLSSCSAVSEVLSAELISSIATASSQFNKDYPNTIYSIVRIENEEKVSFLQFSELQLLDKDSNSARHFICVSDPNSGDENPGWPLRNLVIALAASNTRILNEFEILCLRVCIKEGNLEAGHSLILKLEMDGPELTSMPGVVGWEKNEKGQLGPRFVNMRASMDPVKIAESSVDLNLKLMKWRLVPDLDLEILKQTKFLLLGSGTLGCGVARGLLGWGARNITFVDNAKVSYSNPVRQSLYEFSDCLDGGTSKAKAAAKKVEQIFPGVKAEGIDLTIPMPGHPVSDSTEASVHAAHDTLHKLISEHQVVFLLMDSRESRWLPTVMAACHPEKIVINAALGFDTYLVMRHGVRHLDIEAQSFDLKDCVPGTHLGCYFCNDIVAPGDSMSDRTLDMQCTVTRPGASATAAALAVELAVSCLEHPLGGAAPSQSSSQEQHQAAESVLGLVPHTIRGSLHSFNQFLPTGSAFSQCTACSPTVIKMYKDEGFELVKKVGTCPKYLEDSTGLTELLSNTDIMDSVIGLDDDDTFSMTSDS